MQGGLPPRPPRPPWDVSEQTTDNLQTMLYCLTRIESAGLTYDNVFRIVIMAFMDKYDFGIGSVTRSCTHFVEPNGKIYPFDSWNLFYRDQVRGKPVIFPGNR